MKERKGYTWIDTGNGSGYWSKVTGEAHSHKLPFFCPHCNKACGDVDAKWLEEWGFCWECHTMHVADRQTPTIDVSKYKKSQ